MGLETRRGRAYFYRKRRDGGRVVSEYGGGGEMAALCGRLEAIDREKREDERRAVREDRERMEAIDRGLDSMCQAARALADEALTAAGYRQHDRGQWRKRRGE